MTDGIKNKPEATRCRSCGAPIFWATTRMGKTMPVDAQPTRDGNVAITRLSGEWLATVVRAKQRELFRRERYTSHFATCPNAKQHRKG